MLVIAIKLTLLNAEQSRPKLILVINLFLFYLMIH